MGGVPRVQALHADHLGHRQLGQAAAGEELEQDLVEGLLQGGQDGGRHWGGQTGVIFSQGVGSRGVQAAFLEIKSNLKPNQGVIFFSTQASNQIKGSNCFQIKPQIKPGSSNFHQIKSQIKPPAYDDV